MEIKTLAEILAETSDADNAKASPKNKLSATHQNKNKPSRAQSSVARDFSTSNKRSPASQNNKQSAQAESDMFDTYLIDTDSEPLNQEQSSQEQLNQEQSNQQLVTSKRKHKKKAKPFHPASPYQPKIDAVEPIKDADPNSIRSLLAQVKEEQAKEKEEQEQEKNGQEKEQTDTTNEPNNKQHEQHIDNLPSALKAYLKTPEQRQAEKEEIKANSRLRWLAFYYLSRREHSKGELRQKLIDKEQDPDKIDELLTEFEEKGYQSDYRTALMLIREGIRKRRGRIRIKNDFRKRKVDMPTNIDELIDMATEESDAFVDVMSDNELVEGVDWLQLAVEARVKKYGDDIPSEPKLKARQLRFLQYRGFKPEICFEAIKHNLETLEDRF